MKLKYFEASKIKLQGQNSAKEGFSRVPKKGKTILPGPVKPGICTKANRAALDPEVHFFLSSKSTAQTAAVKSLAPVCLSQNTKS